MIQSTEQYLLPAAPIANGLRQTIAKGSKSFFLASLFFPKSVRHSCWVMYRWCRHCDDRIDNAESPIAAQKEIQAIRQETMASLGLIESHTQLSVEFLEMGQLCQTFNIPAEYTLELIEGFQKDSDGYEYRDFGDIETYSYQVAGVVGLMMAQVMGVRSNEASLPAKSLGIAMQFTNIARDVKEDFERGRVYLPAKWLADHNVGPNDILNAEKRRAVFLVVKRLLKEADHYYKTGYSGLKFLPFRASIAVSIAGEIYAEIGRKILRGGPESLMQRTYVTLPEKLMAVVRGIMRALVRRWF